MQNALKKAARQQIIESAYPVLVTGLTLENNINMKTQAKVVVIGGGVVGTSVLYHLTKLGCKDVMLVERSDLTSGSTWHAAGGMHTINGDPNVAKLQQYTISLYKEIEELSGQDIGLHMTGGVMLAQRKSDLIGSKEFMPRANTWAWMILKLSLLNAQLS